MKVLIVGTGVIGTIYGWALHEAGIDVTHLVRKGKSQNYSDDVTIDILDERKGYKKYNKTNYWKKITEDLENRVFFDLVIVPTNWFQTEAALKMVIPFCKDSFFYILTSNWTGTGMYDHILNKNQYILGYPNGGGTNKEGVYRTNIGPEIHIAEPTTDNKQGFDMINSTFQKANIKLDVQQNMLHWLWVHNAGSIPILVALQKYRNLNKFLADKKLLKKSFIATHECLDLCEKRGAYSKKYPEISAFRMPMWLLIPMFRFNFRYNESMKRYTAHGELIPPDDIKCNYYDILNTARELNLKMTNFQELEELIK
jgi:2-dehydropantoate 2-reductase